MITKQDLLDQRERIQEDLCCILDGLDNEIIDGVCETVVERFEILLLKFDEVSTGKSNENMR